MEIPCFWSHMDQAAVAPAPERATRDFATKLEAALDGSAC